MRRALLVLAALAVLAPGLPAQAQDAPPISRRNGEPPAHVLSREAAFQLRILRTSPDPVVRAGAAAALGREHDTLVLAALITVVLSDPEARVRAAAATSLGSMGDRETADVLREATHDPDPTVASAAREALSALTARTGGPPGARP